MFRGIGFWLWKLVDNWTMCCKQIGKGSGTHIVNFTLHGIKGHIFMQYKNMHTLTTVLNQSKFRMDQILFQLPYDHKRLNIYAIFCYNSAVKFRHKRNMVKLYVTGYFVQCKNGKKYIAE